MGKHGSSQGHDTGRGAAASQNKQGGTIEAVNEISEERSMHSQFSRLSERQVSDSERLSSGTNSEPRAASAATNLVLSSFLAYTGLA